MTINDYCNTADLVSAEYSIQCEINSEYHTQGHETMDEYGVSQRVATGEGLISGTCNERLNIQERIHDKVLPSESSIQGEVVNILEEVDIVTVSDGPFVDVDY